MKLDDLVGLRLLSGRGEYILDNFHGYGDSARVVLYRIDEVWYAFEKDPDDGYRSMLNQVRIATGDELDHIGRTVEFDPVPVNFYMSTVTDENILIGTSERSGEQILAIGTDHIDDYYPSFINYWRPDLI